MPVSVWPRAYTDLIERLPGIVAGARPTFCGFSICVDAIVSLHEAAALLDADDPPEAVALARELKRRAGLGIGGEIRVDWPEGSAWIEERLRCATAMGGTGPHAARMLAILGAPALLALADRSAHQLRHVEPSILVAEGGRAVPAGTIAPSGRPRPSVGIFAYTAGRAVGAIVPPRSSRIIVRFGDPGIEEDAAFEALSARDAAGAGAAVISGFNGVAPDRLEAAIARVRRTVAAWRAAGMQTVHLELAGGYPSSRARTGVVAALDGSITSLGMSQSELLEFEDIPTDLGASMRALGERFGLRRVCVHADGWSAAATLDDPDREREALLMGNLLAATRASLGHPARPTAIDPAATFEEPPFRLETSGPWRLVGCASPHLARPATTLGLGDTFTAGCLLVLGGQDAAARNAAASARRAS